MLRELLAQIPLDGAHRQRQRRPRLRHPCVPCGDQRTRRAGGDSTAAQCPALESAQPAVAARNEALRAVRRLGSRIWKKWSGYVT